MRANEDIARVDCEAGIIATLFYHPDYSFYSEDLLPNHFTNIENRYIYQAICSLARKDITQIDPYIIIQELETNEATRHLAGEITPEQLYTIVDNTDALVRHTVEGYHLLTKAVKDAAFRRDTFQQLRECQQLCLQ